MNQCHCLKCVADTRAGQPPAHLRKMIVCPICGNKRCPHATDHRLTCIGSNEPEQKGSAYE